MLTAEPFTDVICHHGEGPVWDPEAGLLRCVDMDRGALVDVAADGTALRRPVPGPVAAAWRPRSAGGMVVGTERGFALLDAAGAVEREIAAFTSADLRMNEGSCDPDGRFFCGSMAYDQAEGAATLWRLDPDGTVHAVLTGVTVSNGLGWEPGGAFAYYDDTPTQTVAKLHFDDDGSLAGREPWVRIAEEDGAPDGLTVDREGGVWVALFGGGEVRRYAPDGTLDERVRVPGASQTTACALGGPDGDLLHITTSREGLADDEEPRAGSIFAVRVAVGGVDPLPFAG